MKAISTVAVVVAAAAAVGVVIMVGMTGATPQADSVDPKPVANTSTEPEAQPAPSTKAPVVFPPDAFPTEWNFYANNADTQRKLKRIAGQKAPALVVGGFVGKGGTKDLSALRGKPILIDFWGTWCGPCRASIPHINEIAKEHADDLHVIGIHSTRQSDKMAATAAKLSMAYPTAPDIQNRTASTFGVGWWPFYILIDSNGVIRAAGMSSAHLGKAVERMLDIEAGRWPKK